MHIPSTRWGWLSSPEKKPSSNIWKLATPSPSERLYSSVVPGSLYFHTLPAPASKRTETRKRSMRRLQISLSSGADDDSFHFAISGSIRGLPASRCLQRPWGGIYKIVWCCDYVIATIYHWYDLLNRCSSHNRAKVNNKMSITSDGGKFI